MKLGRVCTGCRESCKFTQIKYVFFVSFFPFFFSFHTCTEPRFRQTYNVVQCRLIQAYNVVQCRLIYAYNVTTMHINIGLQCSTMQFDIGIQCRLIQAYNVVQCNLHIKSVDNLYRPSIMNNNLIKLKTNHPSSFYACPLLSIVDPNVIKLAFTWSLSRYRPFRNHGFGS